MKTLERFLTAVGLLMLGALGLSMTLCGGMFTFGALAGISSGGSGLLGGLPLLVMSVSFFAAGCAALYFVYKILRREGRNPADGDDPPNAS